ncbi:phage tail tape measure protein [Bacillus paranthracis]|uniref:phage tail tape measure protein n=1 Tax=Bacillus paranthracis TaxID=2026186 RepID=UPI00148F4325|nr:phage tail tape measure protein [Bacillus paranthracis]NOP83141.1 phage tail tape measure protein [Bacillus paranthracis]
MAGHEQIGVDITVNNGQAESQLRSFQQTAEQTGSKIEQAFSKISAVGDKLTVGVTTPLAAVSAMGIKTAIDFDNSQKKIQKGLGVTSEEAKRLNNDVKAVWKDGFGENVDEVNKSLVTTRRNMSEIDNGKELQRVTKDAMLLADTFDSDISEVTRGANQLMVGFGISSEEAMDLLASGAQNGLDFSKELFDNVSEYGPLFANMGYSADEYFNLLSNGAKNGAYNLDYVNDVMKEFQIRIKDGSKSTSDAMGQMSEGTQKVWKSFLEGKATVKDVNNVVLNELKGMDDQVAANQLGVSLYGTKWEDLEAKTMYSLNEMQGGLGKTAGAMKEMRKAQDESISVKWQKTLREAQTALEPLGKMLLDIAMDILPTVSEAVKDVTEWFNDLSPGAQKAVIALGGIALVAGPTLSVLGRMGGVIGGLVGKLGDFAKVARIGATATAAVEVASGTAALGMGGLGAAIGGAAAAAAPFVAGAAIIGAAGYGIYKGLTTEVIPAVDLFKERINYAADGTIASVDKISKGTQKAVGAFMELSQKTGTELTTMYATQTAINEENMPKIVGQFEEMKNQIVGAYTTQRDEAINKNAEMFTKIQVLTAEQQAQIMEKTNTHYNDKIQATENAKNRIAEIYTNAKNENRGTTEAEHQEIMGLLNTFNQQSIDAMSKNKVEQELLLSNLKESKSRINAEMAADTIKKMNKQRDDAKKAAEDQYQEVKRWVIEQRDVVGSMTAEQAETAINNAREQRDKTIEHAESTRKDGIEKLKGSYKDLEDQVDTSTGTIMDLGGKLARWWDGLTFPKKVMEIVTKGGQMDQYAPKNANGTPFFSGGPSYVNERGGEIMNLPRGTQIIPHDLSKRYIDRAAAKAPGNQGNSTVNHVNLSYNGNNPNDAYKMMDIIDEELGKRTKMNSIFYGQ